MASPQKENGYTPIANEIIEQVAKTKLNGTQFSILLIIWRQTYGFQRKECKISLNFLAKATGINRQQIKRELDSLIKANIIKVTEEANFNRTRTLSFNKDYETWKVDSKRISLQSTNKVTVSEKADLQSADSLTGCKRISLPKKEIIYKENYKEKGYNTVEEIFLEHPRYNKEQLTIIRRYWDIIKFTRKTGKIALNIIAREMKYWEQFPVEIVLEAINIHINRCQSKREEYTRGIMRRLRREREQNRIERGGNNAKHRQYRKEVKDELAEFVR